MDFNAAVEQFKKVLESQQQRAAAMRAQGGFIDYAALPKIVIGICGGDGITAAGSLSATAGEYHITTGGGSGNASYGETAEKWGLWGGLPQQQPTEEQPIINREQIVSDSARGLSAGKSLALSGGTFTLDCSDAALYSVGSTKLSGSRVTISGGDTAITTQQLTLSAGDVSILTARRGAVAEDMTLSGGSLSITAVEEGLALSGGYVRSENDPATDLRKMTVTGGSLSICAGTHALDIGGSLFQSGGSLLLGSGREQNPLRAATAHISGGTLLAAGPLPEELQLYTSLPRISVELWLTGGRREYPHALLHPGNLGRLCYSHQRCPGERYHLLSRLRQRPYRPFPGLNGVPDTTRPAKLPP